MPTSDPLKPPDAIPAAVTDAARQWGDEQTRVQRLPGDASNRIYFRATSKQPSGHTQGKPATFIIALHDSPFPADQFPFLETTALFTTAGVPVPRIFLQQPEAGILVLEDLGDRLLQQVVAEKAPPSVTTPLYEQAVDHIVRLQRHGTPRLDSTIQAGRLALDAGLFHFELDHFFTHAILGLGGLKPTTGQREAVTTAFHGLCTRLDREPQVLCHRDFHSRNLLVTSDGRLVAIDHQDARRGPDTYDLASLLCDPYVTLPEQSAHERIRQFQEARDLAETDAEFGERLDAMTVQRLLKAAGTFAAQKVLHDRSFYLPYLPVALARAHAALLRHDTHADLLAALSPLLPEWSARV